MCLQASGLIGRSVPPNTAALPLRHHRFAALHSRMADGLAALCVQSATLSVSACSQRKMHRALRHLRVYQLVNQPPERAVLANESSLLQFRAVATDTWPGVSSMNERMQQYQQAAAGSRADTTAAETSAREGSTASSSSHSDMPNNVAATLLVDTLRLMKQFEEHGAWLMMHQAGRVKISCLCAHWHDAAQPCSAF